MARIVLIMASRGAGNTYDPAKLSTTGQFNTNEAEVVAKSGPPTVKPMSGRGGAGNFLPPATEPGASPLTGKRGTDTLDWQATVDVEKGLPRPDRVYLGPKEREKEVPSPTSESIPRS